MIRVLQVATRLNVGGVSSHVVSLSTRLDPDRFETRALVGSPEEGEGDMLQLRPDLRDELGARLTYVPYMTRGVGGISEWHALRAIGSEIRTFKPHVVHTHMAKAGTLGRLAARRAGVATVHTYHGTIFAGHFGSTASRAIAWWERALARRTDRIIAVSDAVARDLVARDFPADRIETIPLGLDLVPFLALDPPQPEGRVVLLVARLVPVKDVPLFIAAMDRVRSRIPDVQTVIVGDGPDAAALKSAAPDWVTWRGYAADLARVVQEARVVALSSRSEGSPVALIEALAAARPVAAVPVGGVPDVVGGRGGAVLARDRSPEGLADAIERALTDESVARAALEERSDVATDYGIDRLIADIEALYENLVRPINPR